MTTRTIMAVSVMALALAASIPAQAQTAGLNPNGIDPELEWAPWGGQS